MYSEEMGLALLYACSVLGLIYALINAFLVRQVRMDSQDQETKLTEDQEKVDKMNEIGKLVSDGARAFLIQEYKYLGVFILTFALIIFFAVDYKSDPLEKHDWRAYTTIAFLLGAVTSVVSGYIGMMIATFANTRTAYNCTKGLALGFQVAYRSGCVMGFSLVSLGLLILIIMINIFQAIFGFKDLYNSAGNFKLGFSDPRNIQIFYEYVAGYGLGGSTVALFGRVGGGIYTKAADVGADLVGKVEEDFAEDSPQNPATIADNVGDNVGDIAGMGADLFGSFAESTCAAMVLMSRVPTLYVSNNGASIYFPMMITAFGILVCIFTSFIGTNLMKVNENKQIESTLKWQLVISTILLTPAIAGASYICLPEKIVVEGITDVRGPVDAFGCAICGLWSGLVIGYITEVMTSHSYSPVRDISNSCQTGAATNIIYGLALGYLSTIVPVIALAITCYVSIKLLGMLGVALAALGMLSNLCIGLAIDAYGPISDNAGGIAEMAELGSDIRERTDALDAAGNTTAAVGKGFAIGSAALVSLALYGAFVSRAIQTSNVHKLPSQINILDQLVFSGLLIGAMLPYAFSAMTMKAVGKAALQMVQEVREQLQKNPGIKTGEVKPDYNRCIAISTSASLNMMIPPGALVILTPIILGFLFGPKFIAGLLPGALVSGVQMAISMSNSGGAWDNAKKYIESGQLYIDGVQKKKGTDEHRAAVIGDTVGDPLKDTSGPSLNILIKLMAILSLVFCDFFTKTAYLVCPFGDNTSAAECK